MSASVPLADLARAWPQVREEVMAAFERVAASGRYLLGPELEAFEGEWAAYCGAGGSAGVASGTAALKLALIALGAAPGREVVTSAWTYVATVEAIAATGATPVLVDVDPRTRCMDPEQALAAIGPRTAAVVPVHLHGTPADVSALLGECRRLGVAVLEDAAQAHGAEVGGVRAGSLADAAAFSFYPAKNLGAFGDGGAVTSDDAALLARIASLRTHGIAPDGSGQHLEPGGTERLHELQAAVLRVLLPRLDAANEERAAAAAKYGELLAGLPLELPPGDPAGGRRVWHVYAIGVAQRDRVLASMRADGIGAQTHYSRPVHLEPAWSGLVPAGSLPRAEGMAARTLSLPLFPGITEAEQERAADSLRRALSAH